jgi:hypothetical protein
MSLPPGQQATIVKVQLPLSPELRTGPALIYDEERQHMQARKLTQAEHKLVGRGLKAYCSAWWHGAIGWVLLERAPKQRW